jgi:CheY-like chemotaxis protein
MPKGGQLTIATKNLSVGPDSRPDPAVELPPGRYVCLEVRDTGVGMEGEVLAKIFEPFYTTKQLGQGSGLGLAVVLGIVKQYKGFISVESRPGKGAAFRVYLPCVEGGMDALLPGEAPKSMRGGHETIMVVEDNHALRNMIKRTLRLKGYSVYAQAGGEEALAFLRAHKDEVHILLADLVLPDMDGVELAGRAKSLRPGLKVAYMSGYVGSLMTMAGVLRDSVLIEKPFTPERLLGNIRKLLDCGRAVKHGS